MDRVRRIKSITDIHTLSCVKQKASMKQLCSTAQFAQWPVMILWVRWYGLEGGSRGRGYVYTCS